MDVIYVVRKYINASKSAIASEHQLALPILYKNTYRICVPMLNANDELRSSIMKLTSVYEAVMEV